MPISNYKLSKLARDIDIARDKLKDKLTKRGIQVDDNLTLRQLIARIPTIRIPPTINFRGKGITSISDFNDNNVSVTWTGAPLLVTNGIRTNAGIYGLWTYDMSNWEEFTMCYTFGAHNCNAWHSMINLARPSNNSTYGIKIECNNLNGINVEGISSINNPLAYITTGTAPATQDTPLNTVQHIAVSVSQTYPIHMYVNGVLHRTYDQPSDKPGFNPLRLTDCNQNAFNYRLSNNASTLQCTHYALRLWDVALTAEQIAAEYAADNRDYNIGGGSS